MTSKKRPRARTRPQLDAFQAFRARDAARQRHEKHLRHLAAITAYVPTDKEGMRTSAAELISIQAINKLIARDADKPERIALYERIIAELKA